MDGGAATEPRTANWRGKPEAAQDDEVSCIDGDTEKL